MSEPDAGQAIACDFCDAEAGIFGVVSAEVAGSGAPTVLALVFEYDRLALRAAEEGNGGGSVDDLRAGGVRIERNGAGRRVAATSGDSSLELAFRAGGPRLELRGALPAGADRAVEVAQVSGELVTDGRRVRIECLGTVTRSGAPGAGVAAVRSISAVLDEGALLSAWAVRPEDVAEHGDEAMAAGIAGPGASSEALEELLLSTQYDESGRHRRATLEGWIEVPPVPAEPAADGDGGSPGEAGEEDATDAPPEPAHRLLRGAGTLICGTTVELGGWAVNTAFFRWSVDGRPGLGRYEIARRLPS